MIHDKKTADAARVGRLSIVTTPIGNLEDLTLRALRTLKEAHLILAEDTRRTGKLCKHYGIITRLRPFHAHSNPQTVARCVHELLQGGHLALVTDAGTPLISDPGAVLVREALKQSVAVETIPGPSAVTAALSVSGIEFDSFCFVGFLPRSGAARRRALQNIAEDQNAVVLFESPKRVGRTLAELAELLESDRPVAVCRELTKVHEEVSRGSAAELAKRFQDGTLGEVTLVVGGRVLRSDEPCAFDIDQRITELLDQGLSARDVTRTL
jgi:16S rRNA (cytidine1402-2'-O)-methyltransferase